VLIRRVVQVTVCGLLIYLQRSDALYKHLDSGVPLKGRHMSVAEAIGLMFAFGMFILALLAYIDRNQKK